MSFFDNLFNLNPFAKFFKEVRKEEQILDDEQTKNSQGVSQEEIDLRSIIASENIGTSESSISTIGISCEQYFVTKTGRIQKYREMARYPEIKDSLAQICDQSIITDSNGKVVTLDIKEEMPTHIKDTVMKLWDYLISDVFKFRERGWDLFRKWLIEAELYIELVLNDEGNNIIGIKVLPAHTMLPVFQDNKIVSYLQIGANSQYKGNVNYEMASSYSVGEGIISFDRDQVVYSNYGDIGNNTYDVRGFLDTAIRTFNQLVSMEDSLVVYRLARATERRIWNVYTGRMPKGKADEYVKGLMQRYRKKFIYDPDTGAVNTSQNVQSLLEDFWFTKDDSGNGTTVENFSGGVQLGEMTDVNYFLQKLYKTLALPKSRWENSSESMFTTGKSNEITREEIKFELFVERLQNRFKYLLIDSFITLLRLKGIDERYINPDHFNITFAKSNLFKEYKEMELLEARFTILTNSSQFIYDKESNPQGVFAKEYAFKNFFMMSDEQWKTNKDILEKEKIAKQDNNQTTVANTDFGATEGQPPEFGATEIAPQEIGSTGNIGGTPTPIGATTPPTETPAIAPAAIAPAAIAPESVKFELNKLNENMELFNNWVKIDNQIINKHKQIL